MKQGILVDTWEYGKCTLDHNLFGICLYYISIGIMGQGLNLYRMLYEVFCRKYSVLRTENCLREPTA